MCVLYFVVNNPHFAFSWTKIISPFSPLCQAHFACVQTWTSLWKKIIVKLKQYKCGNHEEGKNGGTLQYILVRFNLNSCHPLCISMSFLAPKNGIMQINCSYYALVSSSTPFDCFNSLLSFIKSFFNLI